MRKYYLLFAAALLLILDIRIPAVTYPVFEAFRTEAPVTVSLVIEHVVGDSLRIDVFSDILGYVLLLAAEAWISMEDRRFRTPFIWGAVSAALYGYQQLMPFYLNGSLRFRAGYLLYFAASLLEICALFSAVYAVTRRLESTSNHSYNNVTVIVAMLCAGTGVVAALVWFFDLTVLSAVYRVAQLAAFFVVCRRIFSYRALLTGENQNA